MQSVNPLPSYQERFLFNDAIEEALINASISSTHIRSWLQVPRGDLIERLYQTFYDDFGLLFTLTSDLSQLDTAKEIISKAKEWLDKPRPSNQETDIVNRCMEGIALFVEYKRALHGAQLVAIPTRR